MSEDLLPLDRHFRIRMTINYYLDKPQDGVKPTQQKETALYLFLRSDRKTLRFNTGHKLLPKYWDAKAQKVKSSFTGSTEFNNFLTTLKGEVQSKILHLSSSGKVISLEDVKEPVNAIVTGKGLRQSGPDFEEAYALFLEAYTATRKPSTLTKFRTILNHLKKYSSSKRKALRFQEIDLSFFEGWTSYLITDAGLTNNTVGKIARLLKTFMHWATERGYNAKLDYRKFKPSGLEKEVQVIALTNEELFRIYNLDLSQNIALSKVRDVKSIAKRSRIVGNVSDFCCFVLTPGRRRTDPPIRAG